VGVRRAYRVTARRIDSHGSEAEAEFARLVLDTAMAGRLKGAGRMTPMPGGDRRGIDVSRHGVRQDSPPKMVRIDDDRWSIRMKATSGATISTATCAIAAPSPTRWPRPQSWSGRSGGKTAPWPMITAPTPYA